MRPVQNLSCLLYTSLDVSVRVIEPVKNLMGFASVKFNDCFVVENLKIVQGSKGLFVGMPSQPDGKGGYRDMALSLIHI